MTYIYIDVTGFGGCTSVKQFRPDARGFSYSVEVKTQLCKKISSARRRAEEGGLIVWDHAHQEGHEVLRGEFRFDDRAVLGIGLPPVLFR
ncbi:hypothetical protein [Pseudomonas sp. Z3-8]|uniref:hypothetical protein n=1 Tax=Pseudomonas sp. Z3-8 TaxID=2817412 RepID=UPI003DA95207